MTLSFDLDDTLIPGTKTFPTEKQNIFQRLTGIEKIRRGTIALIHNLKADGHTINIYTTSLRTPRSIRWMFLTYGITVDTIINQTTHNKVLGNRSTKHSKYPPAFGIDFHIDDSPGLSLEGQKFNFKTVIIHEADNAWVTSIQEALHS